MVLAALADPTRRALLDGIVDAGRASATTLAGALPVSRQAVVKHLQILQAAGLVEGVRRAGKCCTRLAGIRWTPPLGGSPTCPTPGTAG